MIHARKPMMKTKIFLILLRMKICFLSEFQCAAESTKAGAMRDKVDILIAPNRDTSRSSQGTVAAIPTEKINLKVLNHTK